MKNLLFTLVFAMGFAMCAQTKGKITYKFSIDKDSITPLSEEDKENIVKRSVNKHLKDLEPIDTYVLFNKQKALYYVEPRPSLPMWNHNHEESEYIYEDKDFGRILAGGDTTTFTDWDRDLMTNQMNMHGEKYRVLQKRTNWMLKDSTKTILGYKCKLAVSENGKEKIWYTEEIPFGHGPRKYSNLPGLALEVHFKRLLRYTAIKVDFDTDEADYIEEPLGEGKIITVDELRELSGNPFGKKE